MTARRASVLAALLVLVAGLTAACGGGDDEVTAPPRDTTTTSGATVTTVPGTTVPPTVPANTAGITLGTYFMRGEKLGTAHRRVAPTQAVGRAAVEQLLTGPNAEERAAGLTSTVPAGTRLLDLNIANGLATVDLSREFVSGGGSLSMRARLAQVVFTLTQFPTVQSVSFRVDGTPTTTFGGEGVMIGPQVGRAEFTDVTPLILVESVAPGDTITSPVEVAGTSNTFEANVRLRVVGASGKILADTFTTATSGTGTWGAFDANVPFDKGTETSGKVVAFESSAKDGSMINVVEIPVRFG